MIKLNRPPQPLELARFASELRQRLVEFYDLPPEEMAQRRLDFREISAFNQRARPFLMEAFRQKCASGAAKAVTSAGSIASPATIASSMPVMAVISAGIGLDGWRSRAKVSPTA